MEKLAGVGNFNLYVVAVSVIPRMYICVCVCVCVYIYIYIYICVCVCVCVFTCILHIGIMMLFIVTMNVILLQDH